MQAAQPFAKRVGHLGLGRAARPGDGENCFTDSCAAMRGAACSAVIGPRLQRSTKRVGAACRAAQGREASTDDVRQHRMTPMAVPLVGRLVLDHNLELVGVQRVDQALRDDHLAMSPGNAHRHQAVGRQDHKVEVAAVLVAAEPRLHRGCERRSIGVPRCTDHAHGDDRCERARHDRPDIATERERSDEVVADAGDRRNMHCPKRSGRSERDQAHLYREQPHPHRGRSRPRPSPRLEARRPVVDARQNRQRPPGEDEQCCRHRRFVRSSRARANWLASRRLIPSTKWFKANNRSPDLSKISCIRNAAISSRVATGQ